MIKQYKKPLILSSVAILFPIAVGLILWNALPERFATHWGINGEADGWSGKVFGIFASPLTILAAHWLCFWVTSLDPKARAQNKKVFGMIFWICPILSLSVSGMIYSLALNARFQVTSVLLPGLAFTFICIGNYLPKCRHNYTIGIKVPWALSNEENWNATHRFAGRLWVAAGALLLCIGFLPSQKIFVPMLLTVLVMGLAPTFYSWRYYNKQRAAGQSCDVKSAPVDKTTQIVTRAAFAFTAVILVIVTIMLFSGKINYRYEEEYFAVDASFWNETHVDYADIENIQYRSSDIDGSRLWGVGSFRLLAGTFENEEFGNYTRYTYYRPESCVILTVKEKTLVLSGRDAAETEAIYDTLRAKWEES